MPSRSSVASLVSLPEPLEIRWNSEWLASMDMEHVLELTSATVAQMLERADFAERMAEQRPISVLEFLYRFSRGTTQWRSRRTWNWGGLTSCGTS